MNPFFLADGYKLGHHIMMPEGITKVYSNLTPRSNKHAPVGANGEKISKIVSFGQQGFVRFLEGMFKVDFFERNKTEVLSEIKDEFETYLGVDYDMTHIEELWDLGYLPLEIKALPEGTLVPMGVPVLTITNTHPKFAWLTNYLETFLSTMLWKPMTAATIAHEYKKILWKWALMTDKKSTAFVDFQAHDFSMRGMSGVESSMMAGLGHLLSFNGTDNIPAIPAARQYYDAEGFVGGGVPATEHSVMCAGTKDDEIGTFKMLMEKFPSGILSIVSDTWDLWKVCTEYLPELKETITSRDGKLVIRPDSGDPVDIICGLNTSETFLMEEEFEGGWPSEAELKGVVELLWDVFGGAVNSQGFKVLNPHIGVIYGDSITIDRAMKICDRLAKKKFASTNVVLGVGSYTYQYNTRDTFGFAMKATYVEINGEGREIFKDPITDDGTKKSAKGLLQVTKPIIGDYKLYDQSSWEEEKDSQLKTIYKDGTHVGHVNLSQIRDRLRESL